MNTNDADVAIITAKRREPVKVMDNVASVSSGSLYIMAVKQDGSLWAWKMKEDKPKKIMDDVAVADENIAIKTDGSLWEWEIETLADGTETGKIETAKVMDDAAAVSKSFGCTMVIKTDNSLWGWGFNNSGQLGDGTTEMNFTPKKVMDGVISVSAGNNHTMAIKADGSLWVWGGNEFGQLGDGNSKAQLSPVKIMDDVESVSAGGMHTMAVKTDGSLWAWGDNTAGQLGNGSTQSSKKPVRVMDEAASVATAYMRTIAVKKDGTLWEWGANSTIICMNDKAISGSFNDSPVKVMDDVIPVGNAPDIAEPSPETTEEPSVPEIESIRIQVTIDETVYTVNDEFGEMDVPPVIVEGRTLVPVRFFAESFGAEVGWDGDTKTVTIIYEEKTLSFVIGENAPGMDVPAQLLNDRTMVPLRFISEYFNAVVEWDSETRTITIVKLIIVK